MGSNDLPSEKAELSRYDAHNNDVNDPGYQKFVQPMVSAVTADFKPTDAGLDFGAGRGPVISKMLTEKGYYIEQYDPFYANNIKLLEKKYNYIVCCEVVEHFHFPEREFSLLKGLLRDNGKLYIKTSIYSPSIDFEKWYYKNDSTHVFFYQEKTLEFIKNHFGFSDLKIEDNIVIFSSNNKPTDS